MQTIIRILKNVGLGLFVALTPLFQTGLSTGFKSAEVIGGVVIILLGLLKDSVFKEWEATSRGMALAKDFILAILMGIQPVIQTGINEGQALGCILGACGLALFSIVANVIKTDVSATNGWSLVLKDTCTGGLITAQAVIQAGVVAGQEWKIMLGGAGMAVLAVFTNELEEHIPGMGWLKWLKGKS